MSIKQNVKNEAVTKGETLIKSAIEKLIGKNYPEGLIDISKAQALFKQEQSYGNISICLSLAGLFEYLADKSKYLKALTYINDGKYLADETNSTSAKLISEFTLATMDFAEENFAMAKLHYEKALKHSETKDEYKLNKLIKERLQEVKEQKNVSGQRDPLVALLKIGQAVSAETDIDVLLKVIAEETKSAIQADRCSVFLYDRRNNELWSKVALGMDSSEIRFPADKGLAGHVVKTGETINIKDAYLDNRFNKEIDLQTGYKTKTILCMPIKNLNQDIIGAFQVLNKINGTFTEEDEDLLVAIGSSAGIALENAQLFKKQQEMFIEQKQVFDSFIDTLAASIDARDKITAGHSTRVRLYSGIIARELKLNNKLIEIIEKAATLHDIGKIGIRDSVLQKEGKLTDEEYKHIQQHVEITHNILEKIHMSDDFKLVTEIACSHHEKYDGTGYYRHLKGEEITLGGRILAVSDVFDAITSKRHYRDKMPIINVIEILLKDSGSHFDKKIVDSFLSASSDKIIEVFLTENNMILEKVHKEFLKQYSMMDLYNLFTKKSPEKLTAGEKTFLSLFDLYYTAKSTKES
ncbi:MAG: GAF domain-containing protein [Candidatus Gastranaerophilales bacterium]|nr:GAF domain-containing protein [Candidatus Gastranaerophilales bacterium]